jgi:hypothetical protein
VVNITHVPQDHMDRGASHWIAILGRGRYVGRGGIDRLREVKDYLRARCSLFCNQGGSCRSSLRGSRMDQYSEHV